MAGQGRRRRTQRIGGIGGSAATCFALALGLGACTSTDGGADTASTTAATSTTDGSVGDGVGGGEQLSLGVDSLVAACLTEVEDGSIEVDLCVLGIDGSRSIIREAVDPATGPALSPTRDRVAFITGSELAIAAVDGEGEEPLGVEGTDPEWVDEATVALVDPTGRRIISIEVESRADGSLLDLDELALPDALSDALIDDFAVAASGDRYFLSLVDAGQPEMAGDDMFGILEVVDGEPEIVLGPSNVAMNQVDLSPDGSALALSYDVDVHVLDLESGQRTPVSPPAWYGITPSWSPDGTSIAWNGNGADDPQGPAVFVFSDAPTGTTSRPQVATGNVGRPLDRFPAFADWGAPIAERADT